eukprot:g2903.t1
MSSSSSPLLQVQEEDAPQRCYIRVKVALYATLTVLCSSLQGVSFKNLGYSMKPYPYFILIFVSSVFVPIFFLGVFALKRYAGGFRAETKSWRFLSKFWVIGALNAMNGLLIIPSIPFVAGVTQAVLAQSVIPVTLFFSVILLRTRFTAAQITGALIVMAGVLVEILPGLSQGQLSSRPIAALVFAAGQIPQALGSIFQERAFSKSRVNVVHMMAWSALGQFATLVLALPVLFLPIEGLDAGSRPGGIVGYFHEAWSCVAGSQQAPPECTTAAGTMALSICCMLASSIFQTLLVKHSSAALTVLVLTMITPVSAICYTIPALMGSNTEVLGRTQLAALFVLLFGITSYRIADLSSVQDAVATATATHSSTSVSSSSSSSTAAAAAATTTTNADTGSALMKGSPSSPDSIAANRVFSEARNSVPVMLSTRAGIINCEYTSGGFRSARSGELQLLLEGTMFEEELLPETLYSRSV